MIITGLNSLAHYKHLSKNMKTAIEYLEKINFQTIQDGKYEILDKDIYMIISTYNTKENNESKYEAHRKYIDVQCLIEGEELIFCNEASSMKCEGTYKEENDKINFIDRAGDITIHLKPGMVAIFYPSDAHKACCKIGNEPKQVRKLLLKIRL